jgi:hypothetical protein
MGSASALDWVFENSKTKGSGRLVMLAVADAWNPDLGYAFMYVSTLARLTRLTERSVQRGTDLAVAAGELAVEYAAGGPDGHLGRCNRYYLTAFRRPDGAL